MLDHRSQFVIRYRNLQAVCLIFNFLLEDQAIQNLAGVERLHNLRNLAALRNLLHPLLNVLDGDSSASDGCDGIRRGGAGARPLRHEIKQHADGNQADKNSDEDPGKDLFILE